MKKLYSDILVVGASLGGTIASIACARNNEKIIVLESTDWIGGQLTSQACPPDEHKWIGEQGSTKSYREYRRLIRKHYREDPNYSNIIKGREAFCPADSLVSHISHPPKLALEILNNMVKPYIDKGLITIYYNVKYNKVIVKDDSITSIICEIDNELYEISSKYFIDSTDTGELIYLSNTEYSIGSESYSETKEAHAPLVGDKTDMQPFTYTCAIENRKEGDYTIEKPKMYDYFRSLKMPYDKYDIFSMYGPDSSTLKAKEFGMFDKEYSDSNEELFSLFDYRRIIKSDYYKDGIEPYDVTLLNWPQNDYFLGNIIDDDNKEYHLEMAKELTKSFLYYLQTEAKRKDGGIGYPYLRLANEYLGTKDGFSKAPYIRESRRIKAKFTITEEMIIKGSNPIFPRSVGVGSYPIDIHITTKTHTFLNEPTERFTIPLGSFIPIRMKNLIPGCKNIGTTHITSGCYRLHPVEWNIGEVAGELASFCNKLNIIPNDVYENNRIFNRFAKNLDKQGIQRYWID